MKTNCWLMMGLMIATSAVAQGDTNISPVTPAPSIPAPSVPAPTTPAPVVVPAEIAPPDAVTNAPVKPKRKAVAKHKKAPAAEIKRVAIQEPAVTLVAGPAEVAAENVNVRGQAGLKGEFITHLHKGDAVVVLSQLNLDKHQIDEPSQWAKIAFPTNAHVWVNSQFIDATNKTVLARKLNLRAGPGENYSVLGVIERGTPLDTITVRGDWTEVTPPSTAYAFIAAMYLKQEASGNLAANPPASTETQATPTNAPAETPATNTATTTENQTTPAVTTTVAESQPIAAAATNAPEPAPAPVVTLTNVVTVTNTVAVTNEVALTNVIDVPAPAAATTEPAASPATPRIVTHEGVVRHVRSIIEPTSYELYDPQTGAEINYLYTTATNLDLSRYKGMRIVVTGEETLADRWPNTPVLTVDKLEVVK